MAYNHGREERKWRIWKEAEEKILRNCGVPESTIETIRIYDRADFNSNRRFYRYLNDVAEYLEEMSDTLPPKEVNTITDLLNEIENENLYRACVAGYGPTQIANQLFSEGIPTPTEYWQSQGRKTSALPVVPHKWAARTIADILERQEYIGDTVNFRSATRSFKDKTKIERPREEWKVFENTHEAIIDRETWELVQTLRANKRRPNRTGEVSIFSGLLYCGDCGEKLYYSVTNNYKKEQAYFFCSSYRKNTANCTAHYIREKVVYALVLENLQRVLFYVQAFEKQFVQEQLEKSSEEQKKELAKKRREFAKSEKRIADLDVLFQQIYEDNVSGKLTDERFATMSANYEAEQKSLKEAVAMTS